MAKTNRPADVVAKDVWGGLTTFMTMAYIVVVNPAILANDQTGMSFSGVMTATVLVCITMTMLMGLYAKLPFAVAPGMGINAFFAYTLVIGQGVPWPTALGIVFWAGVIFLALSVTPIRVKLATAIPESLRLGSAVGIGMFLAFIGFRNAGWVVADPVTFVKMGEIDFGLIAELVGMFLMVFLMKRKKPWAFLAGMAFITLVFGIHGDIKAPESLVSAPDLDSVFLKLDIWGALQLAFLPAMVAIFFTDLFDSISTFIGVSRATHMVDKSGQPLNLRQGLIVDAFATISAGLFGSSSGTTYMESAAGIEAGARTGKASLVTALCFVPCLFLAPLAAIVPQEAAAPVLILVGAMMFRSIRGLAHERWEDLLPSFLTMILIPLTFSITQGMLWGFLSHVILYPLAGRAKDVSPMMWGVGVLSAVLLWVAP